MKKIETQKEYQFDNYRVQVTEYFDKNWETEVTVFSEDRELVFSGTLEFLETLSAINEELK